MNRCDGWAGYLFATNSEDGVRSNAYGRKMKDFFAGKGTSKGATEFMNNPG